MRSFTLMAAAGAIALGSAGIALASQQGGEDAQASQNGPDVWSKRGMARADADGDGVVTLAEAKARAAERFAQLDADGDGAISAADREADAAQRFEQADTDGDGELSAAELTAARERREAERAQRRAGQQAAMFERLDTDGSGGLSQAELEAGKARFAEGRPEEHGPRMGRGGMGGPGMKLLEHADTDQDKAVSRAEFDAMIEARFARIDSDGSGTITPEERAAARAMLHRGPGRGVMGRGPEAES